MMIKHVNSVQVICIECRVEICDSCASDHQESPLTESHTLLQLFAGSSSIASGVNRENYCRVHKGETVKYYCETCNSPVCLPCTFLDHRGHSINEIRQVRQQVGLRKSFEISTEWFFGLLTRCYRLGFWSLRCQLTDTVAFSCLQIFVKIGSDRPVHNRTKSTIKKLGKRQLMSRFCAAPRRCCLLMAIYIHQTVTAWTMVARFSIVCNFGVIFDEIFPLHYISLLFLNGFTIFGT